MAYRYDLLLQNGLVVDPITDREGIMDLAVRDGRIAAVEPGMDPTQARELFDMTGLHVIPVSHLDSPGGGIRSQWIMSTQKL